MTETHDVDTRLAEGRPAVDHVGEYVWACHLLGYQNPDLTLHSAQVRDWYGSEDGLDLRALEEDRAALASVAAAADGAQQLQDRQLDALADAWRGRGGDASHDFLLRHADASAAAVSAVRAAVDTLAALRDDLWRAVDAKVADAVAIDDRRQGERAEWQAAARTVTTGAGDRAVASELVDQQVKPFVDNDIRTDWVGAMQKAMAAVSAAFEAATDRLTADVPAAFEVPGDLGPSPATPQSQPLSTAPAGWPSSAPSAAPSAPIAGAPTAAPSYPAAPEPPAAAPTSTVPAATPAAAPGIPPVPSLGGMGGGLPGGAGGLGSIGSQLADAIGGLLNGSGDGLPDPDPQELDDDVLDEPDEESDEPEPDEAEVDDTAEVEEVSAEAEDEACPEDVDAEAPLPDPAPTPPPSPMPPPAPLEGPPATEPLGAETPCEIAADELPQAGP